MQEEPRSAGDLAIAIKRQPSTGPDHMEVGVVGQSRSLGMQHCRHCIPRAKAPHISGDGHHRLSGDAEHQVIDRLLGPERDLRDLGCQGQGHVEVVDGQQLLRPRGQPVARGRALAFGAVSVIAGIVSDVVMATFGTLRHMPAERLGSAGLYGRHHLELDQADMTRIGLLPARTMSTEDVSQLQRWVADVLSSKSCLERDRLCCHA